MPDGVDSEDTKNKARGIIGDLVDDILNPNQEIGLIITPMQDFDPCNESPSIRSQIFFYYTAHLWETIYADREPLLEYTEIAKQTIPDEYLISPKIAKQVVSTVAKMMYREYLRTQNPILSFKEGEIVELTR